MKMVMIAIMVMITIRKVMKTIVMVMKMLTPSDDNNICKMSDATHDYAEAVYLSPVQSIYVTMKHALPILPQHYILTRSKATCCAGVGELLPRQMCHIEALTGPNKSTNFQVTHVSMAECTDELQTV